MTRGYVHHTRVERERSMRAGDPAFWTSPL
jgi:hypothetical protein